MSDTTDTTKKDTTTKQPRRTKQKAAETAAPKKTRKNPNYLPWEEARAYIQSEMIESRVNYEKWYQRNQPKGLPRFPYRVYKEWVSWNDFLGVNNKFIKKKVAKWRNFRDAVLWAHTLKLSTQAEWTAYAKSGQKPEDIPARPDIVYLKWVSWNHWLGNKPSERVKAASADDIGVFYVIHDKGTPTNVICYGVEPGGLFALKQRWDRAPYDIIRFFRALRSKMDEVNKIVDSITTPYYGYPNHRITPNVWDVLWYVEQHLDVISDLSAVTEVSATTSRSRGQLPDDLMPIDEMSDI